MIVKRSAYSRSISIEIAVHFGVVAIFYIPILVILFPAAMMLTGILIASSFIPQTRFTHWISADSLSPLMMGIFAALAVAIIGVVAHFYRHQDDSYRLKRLSGSDGDKLEKLISGMWAKISNGPPPALRWFPAFDIAGYAATRNGEPELQISAGLWQAAVSGKDTAIAILAHELAHLRNKDPLVLKVLDGIRVGAACVLAFSALIGLVIFCLVLASEGSTAYADQGFRGMAFRSLLVIVGAAMVLVIFPLSWLALRRHIGLIHSLLEIRADLDATLWTGGRENFTQAFATNKSVRRSGRRELLAALLSRKLSHIPERERLQILRSPALLITPKTQFFALSVLLAAALPLNFASGLILGGALNHLIVQSVAAALNAALVCLLIAGQAEDRVRIGAMRIATLALVSVVVTALPRVNFEPISYLIMSWTLGFGGAPADSSTLFESIQITFEDLFGKVADALLNVEAGIASTVALLALGGLAALSSLPSIQSRGLRVASVGIAAVIGSLLAGFDSYRSLSLPIVVETAAWLKEKEIRHSILLCLPILLALVVDSAFVGLRRAIR